MWPLKDSRSGRYMLQMGLAPVRLETVRLLSVECCIGTGIGSLITLFLLIGQLAEGGEGGGGGS
jgi:hypothetical protein